MSSQGLSEQSAPAAAAAAHAQLSGGRESMSSFSSHLSRTSASSHRNITSIPPNLLPSAPASPPTPAPSPTPHQRPPSWHSVADEDDAFLLNTRIHFSSLSAADRQKFLVGILGLCDNQQLSFVNSYVGPRLRKDPFQALPTELCLRVSLSHPEAPDHVPLCPGWPLILSACTPPSRFSRLSTIRKPSRERPKYHADGGSC